MARLLLNRTHLEFFLSYTCIMRSLELRTNWQQHVFPVVDTCTTWRELRCLFWGSFRKVGRELSKCRLPLKSPNAIPGQVEGSLNGHSFE